MSCIATDEQSSTEAKRGCSAVGSASPCQGEGRGFESRHPLEGAKASAPVVEWPSGEATACKAVHTGSIPVSTSTSFQPGAISSAGERFPDTEEVTGSIPVSRTTFFAGQRQFLSLRFDGVPDTCQTGRVGGLALQREAPTMTTSPLDDTATSWRDLVDQLTPEQIERARRWNTRRTGIRPS